MRLKQGDRVVCKLSLGKLVNCYASYDDTRTFEIIGLDDNGYCLFAPSYFNMLDACKIDRSDIKNFNINIKYIGDSMIYIIDTQVFKIASILDGMSCKQCKEFYHMASSNQNDGTLICWNCKSHGY